MSGPPAWQYVFFVEASAASLPSRAETSVCAPKRLLFVHAPFSAKCLWCALSVELLFCLAVRAVIGSLTACVHFFFNSYGYSQFCAFRNTCCDVCSAHTTRPHTSCNTGGLRHGGLTPACDCAHTRNGRGCKQIEAVNAAALAGSAFRKSHG